MVPNIKLHTFIVIITIVIVITLINIVIIMLHYVIILPFTCLYSYFLISHAYLFKLDCLNFTYLMTSFACMQNFIIFKNE